MIFIFVIEAKKSHKAAIKLGGHHHHHHHKGHHKTGGHQHHKTVKHKKEKHKHIHHTGIQHNTPEIVKPMPPPLIHSTVPAALYSPPFVGPETGQIPNPEQVSLILDWLSKVTSTIDVFLRLQATHPEGSKEQLHLIKNVYPPLRVLLEAQHTHEFSVNK